MKVLFIVDEISRLELAGDTSYALMLEAAARDHEIWTCQVGHLGLEHTEAVAEAQQTRVKEGASYSEAFEVGERERRFLSDFDAVFMRADPPVNVEYLQATWILERARGKTVLVNDPRGLREHNEHLSILSFPEFIPPTLVTRNPLRVREFIAEQGGAAVIKPVDGYGGLGIFVAHQEDPNLGSIIESSTQGGQTWTMAQRYLPDAMVGDKRIVLVDGESIGAVLRVPIKGEARNNLHVGSTPVKTELTPREEEIVAAVAPILREYGQILVGLDVIGNYMTEINITSPTGIRHISRLDGVNAATPVLECVEKKAAALA